MRLVLVSPHRDEIRQEFGPAFQEWFQARTRDRVAAAGEALQGWLDVADSPHQRAAERAFQDLFADWQEGDLPVLHRAYEDWRRQADAERGQALSARLADWGARVPPVELAWEDIGGGTGQLVRYVNARFQGHPEGIGVDLFFGGGTDIYLRFADQQLLQKIDLPARLLERIPSELNGIRLYDADGRWYAPMVSSFGILYNRRVLERIGQPEPRHWADLGGPGMQSWVGAGDPRMSGSVHMVYEIILQRAEGWDDGWRLLLRLGANTHSFIRDSGALTRTVTSGEVAAAGNLDVNALSAMALDPAMIGFHLPDHETVISPDAVAVLKGAPHAKLARAFVEFTLSDAGQKLILLRPGQPGGPRHSALCRLSVVKQLYRDFPAEQRSVGAVNPFELGGTVAYNGQRAISRWDALNDLFGAWIVDAHPDLVASWQSLQQTVLPEGERQHWEEELFVPPCSEAELAAYARRVADDSPRMRTAIITRWGEEARARYRRVRQAAQHPGTASR